MEKTHWHRTHALALSRPRGLIPVRPVAWIALLLAGLASLAGCGYFAVKFAPEKRASTAETPRAKQANEYFWRTLHASLRWLTLQLPSFRWERR